MKMRKLTAVLAMAMCTAGIATAQVPTTTSPTQTPNTTPRSTQQAQQDSIRKAQQNESAQDKTELRDEQRGTVDDGRAPSTNPQSQQPGTRTQEHNRTSTTTTPGGTTIEHERSRTQTHQQGQQPDQTMRQTRTITHPDGRVMTHNYEYYNNNIVVRDETGRRYFIENERWTEVTDTSRLERRMTAEQERMMREEQRTQQGQQGQGVQHGQQGTQPGQGTQRQPQGQQGTQPQGQQPRD